MLDPYGIIPDESYTRREMRYRGGAFNRRESFCPVVCPECNEERWLALPVARTTIQNNRPCRSCANRAKYLKTVASIGKDKLHRRILEAIAARPMNRAEQLIASMLDEILEQDANIDLSFAAQVIVEPFVLDFALYHKGKIVGVIELNGYHHNKFRAARDERVINLFKMDVLFIQYTELRRDPRVIRAALVNYLQGVSKNAAK